MRPTPINSAEAVIEAFHDPQLSELNQWTVTSEGVSGFKIWQNWIWVQWAWQTPAADGRVVRFRRDVEIDCSDYDRLIVNAAIPEGGTYTLHAETDAGPCTRRGEPYGATKREEWLPLDGAKRLTAISIEAHFPQRGPGNAWIYWIALQSTARLPAHLAQWSGYDDHWENYLQPPGFDPTFAPTHGLLLNTEELAAVRQEFAGSSMADSLREAAVDARRVPPEKLIGQYVNMWNSNSLRRERDHGKVITIHGANAAQAGLLFKDKELCRLAARFALSIAHCERWDDSFVCFMPGSTWEQRSFVQSICVFECALILDLCGEWFTPLGRQLILRRIAEEGIGNMNFCGWWWEYIFHCNQLAWFAPGRILGYLLLERTMPARVENYSKPSPSRVMPYTELAVKDLLENLGRCLQPDGGYVEGPTYFTWVARQAFVALHLYARARGLSLQELMPPQIKQTSLMAEVLYSTADDLDVIPICDAMFAFPEALAHLAAFMPDSHWVTIYRKQLRRAGASPSLLAMALSRQIPSEGPALRPFVDMPATGMTGSVRRLQGEIVKLFLMGNKAGAGHTHEDKGNFVLEFAGDSFAMDFGVVDYGNPLVEELKTAQRHNMLTPWSLDQRPKPSNPINADIRALARGDETAFHATMNATAGWEGWFTKWERTWDSPTPDTLVITDDWAVAQGEGVIFHWTTPLPMRREGDKIIIEGRRGIAEITVPTEAEAVIELLPLMNEERRAIDELRREMVRFGLHHADTQPRLTLRQRGRNGTLHVAIKLRLKS
ncbi:MAG: heparinase II/III family protein [Opitutaceae bacterium]|nr:heparinase II/III family protein [Opitutaceae bacterium]MBP9911911.1 heparinase II/III family protein [Opitutaceae bacterium]